MAYRSSTTTSARSTTITGTAPAGLAAGDRMYACWTLDNFSGTLTPPANWVQIGIVSSGVLDFHKHVIYEIKSTSGTENYLFTNSASSDMILQIVAFTGRSSSSGATIVSTLNDTSNTTPVTCGMTGVTAVAGDDILTSCAINQTIEVADWSFSQITDYTERQDDTSTNWVALGMQSRDNVSAGATGTLTTTATRTSGLGNAGWSSFVISIPSAVSFTPTITIF